MNTGFILLASLLGLATNALAQTRPLPNVQAPKELTMGDFSEGTVTRLSKQDVDQYVPWAQNAQNVLTKALKDSKLMPVKERLRHIESAVKSVVRNSGTKNYQMFMRFSLNRGLLLSEELKRQAQIDDIGIRENVLDILVKSINIALSFYESDLNFQKRAQAGNDSIAQDYARFGLIFARGMMVSVQNVYDASAEYRLLYKLYEMVNWDLSRDPNALNFSDQIVEIYDRINSMSELPSQDDEENLRNIRRLMLLKDSVEQVYVLSEKAYKDAALERDMVEAFAKGDYSAVPDQMLVDDARNGKMEVCSISGYSEYYRLEFDGRFKQLYNQVSAAASDLRYYLKNRTCKYKVEPKI